MYSATLIKRQIIGRKCLTSIAGGCLTEDSNIFMYFVRVCFRNGYRLVGRDEEDGCIMYTLYIEEIIE